MKINVFTDLRFTSHVKQTGVGKHIFQMVNGIHQDEKHDVSLLAADDQSEHHRSGSLSFLPARKLPRSWKSAEVLWTLTGHPLADKWCDNPDWIYCPKNDFIPVKNSRVAVTVHGAHELDPDFPQPSNLASRLTRVRRRMSYGRMLKNADLVLTVSEFLKQQMIDWFAVPEEKFCVVGNGVEAEFFHAADIPNGSSGQPTDRPYILCVGGLNSLDGGDRIIKVAEVIQRLQPDLRVLIAGGDHNPDLLAQIDADSNIELLGYTHSDQLALLMRDAIALLYPTRYETFGIAAAEAMAVGTPVVTCRSTAIPEIVGDAGLYAGEDDPHEMAEMILALFNSPALMRKHSEMGRDRACDCTWSACVERLIHALER